jgi:cytochrome b
MTRNSGAHRSTTTVRVWDPVVRLFHWGLAASFAAAWLTSDSRGQIHTVIGYCAAALLAIRFVWGLIGPGYARFAQFVRGPRDVFGYLAAMARGAEARFIGHNPAGGAMVIALLAGLAATAFTGWLMTTDAYFGDELVQELHSIAATSVLLLVAAHVGGVILASVRHRENLVKAMITGRKRPAAPGDVG